MADLEVAALLEELAVPAEVAIMLIRRLEAQVLLEKGTLVGKLPAVMVAAAVVQVQREMQAAGYQLVVQGCHLRLRGKRFTMQAVAVAAASRQAKVELAARAAVARAPLRNRQLLLHLAHLTLVVVAVAEPTRAEQVLQAAVELSLFVIL